MNIINVLEHGVKKGGTLCTKEFQRIVDEFSCAENTIVFPKGNYTLSTIHLRNDTHIYVDRGAVILGSLNFNDFERDEKVDYPLYQDQSHSFFHCSLFVGENVSNISFSGNGKIDMQGVWDEENVRGIVHRGCKCIALKECDNIIIEKLKIRNVTDLAIYFAGCDNVKVRNLDLKVYIDGISPDNSKNVVIENCKVESGDDGIVFKSSYTLNRLDFCKNIIVKNCKISSRCNAIKFGTESNGGFYDFDLSNIIINNARITGISVESVDGANIDNIRFKNIRMKNVNAPIFVFLGKRMRGPSDLTIGSIKNIAFKNIYASGPYKPYNIIPWNYDSFIRKDYVQIPWVFDPNSKKDRETKKSDGWQFTSNICGLENHELENISLSNIYFKLNGGVKEFNRDVPKEAAPYPEVFAYGKVLPASGIYTRYVKNLSMNNIKIKTHYMDLREKIIND